MSRKIEPSLYYQISQKLVMFAVVVQIKRKCLFFLFFVNLHWRKFSPLIFRDWKGGRREKERDTHTHTHCFPHSPWMGQEPAGQVCALGQTQTCDPASMQEHWPGLFFFSYLKGRKISSSQNRFCFTRQLFQYLLKWFCYLYQIVSGGRVLYLFSFLCNIT